MVIRFNPKFTNAQISRYLTKRVAQIEKAVLSRLQRVGEAFVANARLNGNYNDVTGNLRSSIGYVILKDGVQITENFGPFAKRKYGGEKAVKRGRYGGFAGQDGVIEAKRVAEEAALNYPNGYVLIAVAGMGYAASVEARGKDVITGSSKIAEHDLIAAIRGLQNKLA